MARLPEALSLEAGASIVGGALTAINAIGRSAKLQSNTAVLVAGATGSVGVAGMQPANHLGADVSAVCHSTSMDFALSTGATHAYAYDRTEMPEPNTQFDLVFDTAPSMSFSSARQYLTVRGTYVTTMPHKDVSGFIRAAFSRKSRVTSWK